jgi:hypothetical protein
MDADKREERDRLHREIVDAVVASPLDGKETLAILEDVIASVIASACPDCRLNLVRALEASIPRIRKVADAVADHAGLEPLCPHGRPWQTRLHS